MNPEEGHTNAETASFEPGATLRSLAAGQVVAGRFRLESVLGRGGMGVVWRATDESLGSKPRALKFLVESVAHDQLAVAELKEEVARCQELSHPNILRVHDLVQDESAGIVAVSMELASGGTLNGFRANRPYRWFEPQELGEWLAQLCEALDYAHSEARIVHRDLKPANLLLDDRGRLKVADFGIAHALTDSVTRITHGESRTSGTPAYMSPQQASGTRSNASDDIYALGATLYDLLTGKPPYLGGHQSVVLNQLLDPNITPSPIAARRRELRNVDAPIPEYWESVIAQCLAKDASARPASAGEVAGRLLNAESYPTMGDTVAEVNGPSATPHAAIFASPTHAPTGTMSVNVSFGAESKGPNQEQSPEHLPRNRGCTFTLALSLCLTVMLGARFVQESIQQTRALRAERLSRSGASAPEPVATDVAVPTPMPSEQATEGPMLTPQQIQERADREAEKAAEDLAAEERKTQILQQEQERRIGEERRQAELEIQRKQQEIALTRPKQPTPRPPRLPHGNLPPEYVPKGSGRSVGGPTEAEIKRIPFAARQSRAEALAREGTALLPGDPLLAKAKAELALRYWPDCPQAEELLRSIQAQFNHSAPPSSTPSVVRPPTPRPLGLPHGNMPPGG